MPVLRLIPLILGLFLAQNVLAEEIHRKGIFEADIYVEFTDKGWRAVLDRQTRSETYLWLGAPPKKVTAMKGHFFSASIEVVSPCRRNCYGRVLSVGNLLHPAALPRPFFPLSK